MYIWVLWYVWKLYKIEDFIISVSVIELMQNGANGRCLCMLKYWYLYQLHLLFGFCIICRYTMVNIIIRVSYSAIIATSLFHGYRFYHLLRPIFVNHSIHYIVYILGTSENWRIRRRNAIFSAINLYVLSIM